MLHTSFDLGPLKLANRIVMAPLSNVLARNRLPSAAQAAFYAVRAEGGVGLIVSEGLRVHPTNCSPTSIGMFDAAVVPGLREIARRVAEHGVPIIGQLMHGGRQSHQHIPHLLWAPSAIACAYSGYMPHAMSTAEVESMRDHFIDAALRVQDAGWAGIDLHAAQGHLVQQFLSPLSNQRTDRYGGSFERRMQFPLEVLAAIRERCGPGFIVGVRLSSSEFTAGGLDLPDAIAIAQGLDQSGLIDYLSVGQANFMSIAAHIPDRREPVHPFAEHCKVIRAAIKVPVIGSSRIRTPAEAQQLLDEGCADLIGLGRPLVADPQWARKATTGRADTIRGCIYCNVCWHGITTQGAITCIQNPYAGREADLPPIQPSKSPKCVVVIGGGPAGLAAAQAAAERGHQVTLFERDKTLGGQLRIASLVPGDAEIANVARYLEQTVWGLGVELRLGTEATVEAVSTLGPDVVLLASGSVPATYSDAAPGIPTLSAIEVIRRWTSDTKRDARPQWRHALRRVVIDDRDGYFATYAVAEMLAGEGVEVDLVTFHHQIGHDLPATNVTTVLGRLDSLGVRMHIASRVVAVDQQGVTLQHVYSGRQSRLAPIDTLVVAGDHRALDVLRDPLARALPGARVTLIGDAVSPRAIKDAIHEGHHAGRSI